MPPQAFAFGDRLTHAAKPEWGVGEVVRAQGVTHEGKACQRLQVRFERAGLKTVSTAIADLRPAGAVEVDQPTGAVTKTVDLSDPQEAMSRVPAGAMDPFASVAKRLEATLEWFTYTAEGGSLLDWASVQSGMADPMERFNRHELEAFFERFRFKLGAHLAELVRELRRQDPVELRRIMATAPAEGRAAVNRFHSRG